MYFLVFDFVLLKGLVVYLNLKDNLIRWKNVCIMKMGLYGFFGVESIY